MFDKLKTEILNLFSDSLKSRILKRYILKNKGKITGKEISLILKDYKNVNEITSFLNFLIDNSYFDILVDLDENYLVWKFNDYKTILEILIDKNYTPTTRKIYLNDSMRIIYEKNRLDLFSRVTGKEVLNEITESFTYFDYLLDCIKDKSIKVEILNSVMSDFSEFKDIAIAYMIIAEHGMLEYIVQLTEDKLLKKDNNKTLLEELLDLDSDLTFRYLLDEKLKSNIKIAAILKSYGYNYDDIDVIDDEKDYTKDYRNAVLNSSGVGPLIRKGEFLLKKLEKLFLTDGKSDPDLITALIAGYKQALFVNYEINLKELRKLIRIKEKNKNKFFYIKYDGRAHFSPNGSVYSTDTVSTILHETGHAMHYYSTNFCVPKLFKIAMEELQNDPVFLKEVEKYSTDYLKIKEKINIIIANKEDSFVPNLYTDEYITKIETILKKSKAEQKEVFKDLGIDEELLDIILNDFFTIDEYRLQEERNFYNQHVDEILDSEYTAFGSICDILDSITEGYFFSGELKNQKGKYIHGAIGHGINYYSKFNNCFAEIIAEFAVLTKIKDSDIYLKELKSIIGDKLFNIVSNFYYLMIVGVSKEEISYLENNDKEDNISYGGKR